MVKSHIMRKKLDGDEPDQSGMWWLEAEEMELAR